MKKVFYLTVALISCVVLTTALVGASSKGTKFNLKLDANKRTIEAIKSNPIMENNKNKFERKENKFQLHLNLTLSSDIQKISDHYQLFL